VHCQDFFYYSFDIFQTFKVEENYHSAGSEENKGQEISPERVTDIFEV
jgi:hypothetical protein